jgi:hypothetical protein
VPATRWVLSSQTKPPTGYAISKPKITFDARNYPEFPEGEESWEYTKIDIREDAFSRTGSAALDDPELKNYASKIRSELRACLSKKIQDKVDLSSWETTTNAVVKKIVDNPNSVAAIQGSLRMSGLFAKKGGERTDDRFVSFEDAPDPAKLVESSRVYTMFPQMPYPMPLPSTSPEELQNEIESRPMRMLDSGRDPHKDKYGRVFTHISTSNVSNTIHGVYFTFDVTNLLGVGKAAPPALDLFGSNKIEREWVSLSDLSVLENGRTLSTADTKSTFISGFIVRQLVKEGIIKIQ